MAAKTLCVGFILLAGSSALPSKSVRGLLQQQRETITSPNKVPAGSKYCDVNGGDATYSEVIVGDQRIITATGCPNHFNACQKRQCTTRESESIWANYTLVVPAFPTLATTSTNTTCTTMDIAIALNGVSINGPGSGTGDCSDAVQSEGYTFDIGGGHAGTTGHYHYHVAPAELLMMIGDGLLVNGTVPHSKQVGWSYDGFPIYGPHGPDGVTMYPCTSTSTLKNSTYCLDTCGGWAGELPTVDQFKYRYYFTGPVGNGVCSTTVINGKAACQFGGASDLACCIDEVPDTSFYPYTLGCWKGCAYSSTTTCQGTPGYTYVTPTVATSLVTIPSTTETTINANGTATTNSSYVMATVAPTGVSTNLNLTSTSGNAPVTEAPVTGGASTLSYVTGSAFAVLGTLALWISAIV